MDSKNPLVSPVSATLSKKIYAIFNLTLAIFLPLAMLIFFSLKQNYTTVQIAVGVAFFILFLPYCAKNVYFQIKEINNKTYLNTINLSKFQIVRKVSEPFILTVFWTLFLLYLVFFSYVKIAGDSMRPTYVDGQVVFIKTFRVKPATNKVYVIAVSEDNGKIYNVIKRIYALPGDKITLTETKLEVDGKTVLPRGFTRFSDRDIENLKKSTLDKSYDYNQYWVKDNTYLFFGDNFTNSRDSRTEGLRFKKIIGEVI